MKVSLNWVKDYVKLPEDMDLTRLAYDLTMSTVEVEGAEDLAKRFEHMLVGVVTEVCPHPNADKLRICRTDIGGGTVKEIVCGGTNLRDGMKVAVALPGSVCRWHGEGEPVEIKESKLRGVKSYGMICAASEIGMIDTKHVELNDVKNMFHARISVIIFIAATLLIVLFGSIPAMRPVFNGTALDMPAIIEILMLCAAAVILLISRTDGIKATQGSVFPAGMQAVIAIFGIAWMGDTFINGNITELTGSIEGIVRQMPWLFGLALFVMSILLYSQAATVRAIVPLGIALGISPMMLIALFPAVNGYFFIPNYPTVVAAINFDRTGTTGIGKWILNHSFMMPGMVATIVSIVIGLLLVQVF